MSQIHLNRIKHALEERFDNKIDLEDCSNRPYDTKRNVFLSRALAAFSISIHANIDPSISAQSVTDGYEDNGIDAIYFDRSNDILYLVQSKWIEKGNGSVTVEVCKKLIDGFNDLLHPRFDRFNAKVEMKRDEIEEAIKNSDVKFVLIIVHSGTEKISKHVQSELDLSLSKINDTCDVVAYEVFDQARLYDSLVGNYQNKINLEIMLHEWGRVKDPYIAYYGQVNVNEIAKWWKQYESNLFARNLRSFKGSNEVNNALELTLRENAFHFWYFNNGITVICNKIKKQSIGGDDRQTGVFDCEEVNIVNGAQTVGVIGNFVEGLESEMKNASVLVRLISLENCSEGFDKGFHQEISG